MYIRSALSISSLMWPASFGLWLGGNLHIVVCWVFYAILDRKFQRKIRAVVHVGVSLTWSHTLKVV